MFRINNIDPSKVEVSTKVNKIRSLLSKTIVSVRNSQEKDADFP
jgi:hypothetical protein